MRVVIVAAPHERARLRQQALSAGLTVVGEADTLADASRIAGADGVLLAPPHAPDPDEVSESLTPREHDVLELLAEGLPNKAIAARLGISAETVKFHVASICGKLGASNRTEAVRKAILKGLLTL